MKPHKKDEEKIMAPTWVKLLIEAKAEGFQEGLKQAIKCVDLGRRNQHSIRLGGWKGIINQLQDKWNEDLFVETIIDTEYQCRQEILDSLKKLLNPKNNG